MSENSKRDHLGHENVSGVTRRGVVAAAGWSVPVVAVSMATSAAAASQEPVEILTLLFSKPIYTVDPNATFTGAEAVRAILQDTGNVPVPNAVVELTIVPADGSDPEDPDDDDADEKLTDDVEPTAWFLVSGVKKTTIQMTTDATGWVAPVVVAGPGSGSLAITGKVISIPGKPAVSAAAESILRISEIRQAWAWGDGGSGALGIGTTKTSPVPVAVAFPPTVHSVTKLFSGEHRRGFAVDDAKRVWAWGSDSHNNLFDNGNTKAPLDVTGLFPSPVKQIDGGYYVTYALLEDGTVWGWGYKAYEAFFQKTGGTSPSTYQETPIRLQFEKNPTPLPAAITKIAATRHNAYLLLANGQVWTWGRGYCYSLGNGSTATSNVLVPVQGLPTDSPVKDIDARYYGATVVTEDGRVYSWGWNDDGEAGVGNTTDVRTATQVVGISGKAVRIGTGWRNAGVVMEDGSVYVWGMGTNYALGNGSTADGKSATRLTFPSPAVSLVYGYQTGHVLLQNGTVWGWGRNNSGQVGTGKKVVVKTPTQVIGIPGVVAQLAATQYSTFATILDN